MCAEVTAQLAAALDDDLDTRAALRSLRRLEKDAEIPAGSKFETFLHADQVLGLDLAADIGRRAGPPPLPGGAAQKLAERNAARAAQDWATADRLRHELAGIGVIVADTADGQAWTVGSGG
jgi:cysteinyl-tRNA synthetase